MNKTRTNITISPRIKDLARKLMHGQGFDDFSGFVEHLIRQEHAKMFGTWIISESGEAPKVPDPDAPSEKPARKTSKSAKPSKALKESKEPKGEA